MESMDALERLRSQLLQRWKAFPETQALDRALKEALEQATQAEPETITVSTPVSRPMRLRLAVLAVDRNLDPFYQREWAELSVSSRGMCYLVYRRRDGGHYAIEWSPSTVLPGTMNQQLPDLLAMAMLEGDD